MDLAVLYATQALQDSRSTQALRHVHWFPRSLRSSLIDRAIGRDYPVHWAIWKSFHALRPDCMIIAGWDTFAAQAALTWCLARRVPFLLVLDESTHARRVDRNGRWQHALVDTAFRNAAAVLVPAQSGNGSLAALAVHSDRRGSLPEATDAAAARVRDLARSAWITNSTRPLLAASIAFGARDLSRSVTRHARRRRTHSAHGGRPG